MTAIAAAGVVCAALALLLRREHPAVSMCITIAAGAALLMSLADSILQIISVMRGLAEKYDMRSEYINLVLKATGVAYAAEFAAQTCRDAGEGSIAAKIELGARVLIVCMSLPVLTALLDTAMKVLPS